MPRGDKGSYSGKKKRQAEHIEEGYEKRGVGKKEAERRAWATVNKSTGGGQKTGSGRGQGRSKAPAKRGGRRAGAPWARRPPAPRGRPGEEGEATRIGKFTPPGRARKSASRKSA